MAAIDLDAKRLARQVTLTVKVKRYQGWRYRLTLAKGLIRLAAWIAWVNVELEGFED